MPLKSQELDDTKVDSGEKLQAGGCWKLEAGSRMLEAGSRKPEARAWKVEAGRWKLDGNLKLEARSWMLKNGSCKSELSSLRQGFPLQLLSFLHSL